MRQRLHPRDDRGATTAEYVGILVLVSAIVATILTLATPVGQQLSCRLTGAFNAATGGSGDGCSASAPPQYEPDECEMSSHDGGAGGSVTVVVTLGGDGQYQLQHIQRRQPDGTWKDAWVVSTSYSGKLGYEVGEGGKAQTGGSEASGAGEDVKVGIEVKGTAGQSYEFDNEADAKNAVNEWKKHNDPRPWVDGHIRAPVETEYVQGEGSAYVQGTAGPASGEVRATAVTGLVHNKRTGESTVSYTTTAEAAADIGLPLPKAYLALAASGKASRSVGVAVTLDKAGHIVSMQVSMVGTVSSEASIGLDGDQLPAGTTSTMEDVGLPTSIDVAGGRQFRLTATTDFRNPDGTLNYSAAAAVKSAVVNAVTSGQSPTAEERAAIHDQLNNRSQLTFDTYDYASGDDSYGGEIKAGPVGVGGEVHVVTEDTKLLNGQYFNPQTGQWMQRLGCKA